VSTAGGVQNAPARAAALYSRVLQLFTKQPARWAERSFDVATIEEFRAARAEHGIDFVASHDSYLINLATPDPALFAQSFASFRGEIERCDALGIDSIVSHPGNATDGDRARGIARNAGAIERALDETDSSIHVLLETTAGSGYALGSSFEELADLIGRVSPARRGQIGVCLDTCHVWAAGYDLRERYDEVIARFDDAIGLDRLRLFHLNDSLAGLGSRRDRHRGIGEGALGETPFMRLVTDDRFTNVPKVLETPKGRDPVRADRRNLRRLRGYRK
jgi:deoxyribonuclease-4